MAMTLITNSADTDSTDLASISFTSGIDSTYKLYIFKYFDVNAATDAAEFSFQANASGQSGYNETMTTTTFRAYHRENDTGAEVTYVADYDQAQGTGFQSLTEDTGNGADECSAGELFLFNPSNTTYVKHFYGRSNSYHSSDISLDFFVAGYFNVTAAITNIQFKMDSGNFDGTIKMYGVG